MYVCRVLVNPMPGCGMYTSHLNLARTLKSKGILKLFLKVFLCYLPAFFIVYVNKNQRKANIL